MKKFYLTIILVFLISTSIVATTIDDLRNQQNTINNKIEDYQGEVEAISEEIRKIEMEIILLDQDYTIAEKNYITINENLEKEEFNLLMIEAELEEAIQERELQYEILKERLVYMYEYGSTEYIEIIFNSKSVNDLFNKMEYINVIANYDKDLLEKYEEIEKTINKKYIEAEDKKNEVELLLAEAIIKKEELELIRSKKNNYLNNLVEKEQQYLEEILSLENASAEAERKIKEAEEKARLALQSKNITYSGGQLAWPAPGYSTITSEFGNRLHPVYNENRFHSGLDIAMPTGANIVAAEAGVVINSSYLSGYGYTVIIDHGSGVSTLYAHNSVLVVNEGDFVARGQNISKAGSTGVSTGPHLHFEVRINGAVQNPLSYLN